MKKLLLTTLIATASTSALASVETLDWHNTASESGKEFVRDSIVLDFIASPAEAGWWGDHQVANYLDLAVSRGITGGTWTIGVNQTSIDQWKKDQDKFIAAMESSKSGLLVVRNVEDYKKAHDEGKYAVMWNNQSTLMLDGDIRNIEKMYDLGLRQSMLAYNGVEKTGGGVIAYINEEDTGLTEFGKQVIDEFMRLGITLDFSHGSTDLINSSLDYVEKHYPDTPVIISHSPVASTYNCEATETLKETADRMDKLGLKEGDKDYRHSGCYRLVTDEDAKRVAATGGVVGVTFTEWMMDGVWSDNITPKESAEMLHGAVKVVGVDHVSIGTDDMMSLERVVHFAEKNPEIYADNGYMLHAFEVGTAGCAELSKHMAAVTDELRQMGYSDTDLKKLFGGNLLRVYEETWK